MLIPITDHQLDYARQVAAHLEDSGLRVEINERDDRMQGKVRAFEIEKIPYALILGKREVANEQVSVRDLTEDNLGAMSLEEFLELSRAEREREKAA